MRNFFETIKDESPFKAGILAPPLILFSMIYSAAVRIRLFLFGIGILKTERVEGAKVISVGNITVGGSGKTPMAVYLARFLTETGRKPAIVSRGYGRESREAVQVVSDGAELKADYPDAGDEAVLCAGSLKGTPIICSPKRVDGIKAAINEFGADAILLDDAFSHLQAGRDLNIVLIDAFNPFGNGWLFPAGPLREPFSSLKRADAVFITRAGLADEDKITELAGRVKRLSPSAGIFLFDIEPGEITTPEGERKPAREFLKDREIFLFSGIASPEQFEKTANGLGAIVKGHFAFPDHHPYTVGDADAALSKGGGKIPVVTTEKDFVRLAPDIRDRFYRLTITVKPREDERLKSFLLESMKG